MAAEPNYAFAKGYGRFGIGYTRLARALGNFEQGNIQAESTVVASVADLRAKSCHVPHRVESAVSPLYADQSSLLAQANLASTLELPPTRQCRLTKTVMRSTSSWLP